MFVQALETLQLFLRHKMDHLIPHASEGLHLGRCAQGFIPWYAVPYPLAKMARVPVAWKLKELNFRRKPVLFAIWWPCLKRCCRSYAEKVDQRNPPLKYAGGAPE